MDLHVAYRQHQLTRGVGVPPAPPRAGTTGSLRPEDVGCRLAARHLTCSREEEKEKQQEEGQTDKTHSLAFYKIRCDPNKIELLMSKYCHLVVRQKKNHTGNHVQ